MTEGFLDTPPGDVGTPEFRSRISKMIDDVKIFAKQVLNVFMSPGASELVIFDEKKERLW